MKFYSIRSSQINDISITKSRSNFLRNSFFPSTITELYHNIRNSDSLSVVKLSLLKFVRPIANNVFDINNPYGSILLTRLRLGLSHLRYHKFRHIFQDCISPIYAHGLEIKVQPISYSTAPSFNLLDDPSYWILRKLMNEF